MADPSRKGKKLRRVAKLKSYYAAQYSNTERNQKRALATHVRHNPEDQGAIKRLEEMIGKTALAGHLANIVGRAKDRAARLKRAQTRHARAGAFP